MKMLKETSRTFYIPITMLNRTLRKAVGSAYLCMRAIDEIEDHLTMKSADKQAVLRETAEILKSPFDEAAYLKLIAPHKDILPEVSLRLGDWIRFCPEGIVKRVQEASAKMALGMADWVEKDFHIHTK